MSDSAAIATVTVDGEVSVQDMAVGEEDTPPLTKNRVVAPSHAKRHHFNTCTKRLGYAHNFYHMFVHSKYMIYMYIPLASVQY